MGITPATTSHPWSTSMMRHPSKCTAPLWRLLDVRQFPPARDLPQILYLNVLRSLVVLCTTERFGLKNCKGLICCLLIAADDPALGAPVEYIDLRGTSYDNPMVCKYTGQGARISDPVSCAWHKHWKYDTMTHIINCSQCVAHIRQQLMCAWPCR